MIHVAMITFISCKSFKLNHDYKPRKSDLFVKNEPFKDDSVSFIASIMKVSPNVLPVRPKSHLKDQSISRI